MIRYLYVGADLLYNEGVFCGMQRLIFTAVQEMVITDDTKRESIGHSRA